MAKSNLRNEIKSYIVRQSVTVDHRSNAARGRMKGSVCRLQGKTAAKESVLVEESVDRRHSEAAEIPVLAEPMIAESTLEH